MKSQHTQGKWKCFPNEEGDFTISTLDESSLLAIVGTEFPLDEAQANAKLIAASPNMLKEIMLTYLKIQILTNEDVNLSMPTDSIRANLRNTISEAIGISDYEVQSWCEQAAREYDLNNAWKAIKKATS